MGRGVYKKGFRLEPEWHTSGVYSITCTINDRKYIGSSVNCYKRREEHRFHLRHNTHHSKLLQEDYNLYGEDKFIFEIVEKIEDTDTLKEREQYWIDFLETYKNGYNVCPYAKDSTGYRFSEEKKEEMRQYWREHPRKVNTKGLILGWEQSKEIQNRPEVREKIQQTRKNNIKKGVLPKYYKLTEEQVIEILKRLKNGERACDLAIEYGVRDSCISRIKNKTHWEYLADEHPELYE